MTWIQGSPGWLLVWVVGIVVVQRLSELVLSARHARWIQAQGGIECGQGHYPWMVALHGAFVASLPAEYLLRSSHRVYLLCLIPLLVAQCLRYAAMASLGRFWNTRLWVIPGRAPVRRGIYRWMRHPNYAGVVLEFFFLPVLFGLWWTAVIFSLLNLLILRVRIRAEDNALSLPEIWGQAP